MDPTRPSNHMAHKPLTIKDPPFAYMHLRLLTTGSMIVPIGNKPPIDVLTARTYLTSALEQFLGLTGTAIPIDFLKIGGRDIWIRIPSEDAPAVAAAVSQWTSKGGDSSWRIRSRGEWLGGLIAGDGRDLFRG